MSREVVDRAQKQPAGRPCLVVGLRACALCGHGQGSVVEHSPATGLEFAPVCCGPYHLPWPVSEHASHVSGNLVLSYSIRDEKNDKIHYSVSNRVALTSRPALISSGLARRPKSVPSLELLQGAPRNAKYKKDSSKVRTTQPSLACASSCRPMTTQCQLIVLM